MIEEISLAASLLTVARAIFTTPEGLAAAVFTACFIASLVYRAYRFTVARFCETIQKPVATLGEQFSEIQQQHADFLEKFNKVVEERKDNYVSTEQLVSLVETNTAKATHLVKKIDELMDSQVNTEQLVHLVSTNTSASTNLVSKIDTLIEEWRRNRA